MFMVIGCQNNLKIENQQIKNILIMKKKEMKDTKGEKNEC